MSQSDLEWLWTGYVPRSVVTVVSGPQSVGKTALLAELAASVTTGTAFKTGVVVPLRGDVLWYTVEDDPSTILAARLKGAGVLLGRVLMPDYDSFGSRIRTTTWPSSLGQVAALVGQVCPGLIVFDPLTSFLAGGFSPNDPVQVRVVMDALTRLAAATTAAVVVTLHTRKSRSGHPLEWIAGSAAWSQAARQVISLERHPSLPDHYLLSVLKRCSAQPAPPWLYRLPVEDGTPQFELVSETALDVRELAEVGSLTDEHEESIARGWLEAELSEERDQRIVYQRWQAAGFGRNLWWRVRRLLRVGYRRVGPPGEQSTFIFLPGKSYSHTLPPTDTHPPRQND